MYAVVNIAGRQFKVSEREKLVVPTLRKSVGETVTFDTVLMVQREKELAVGNPFVPGASIEATVVRHGKGDKVTVFKKKKRKGYRVLRGHRQGYTEIQVTKVG